MAKLSIGIIGGGIGGFSAAAALNHFGFETTVYEKAERLREQGAGMMLWANATRVLDELGLLGRVVAASGPTENFLVRNSRGDKLMDIATGDFEVPSICIPRSDFLSILAAAHPAERVRTGHEFVRLEQTRNKVRVRFAGGQTAEHDLVLGADGLRSPVRTQVFGPREPVYRGYIIWRGIGVDTAGAMPPETSSETWGRGRRFGILNTGGGRYTWYAAVNVPQDHPDAPAGRKAELLDIFRDWHAPVEELIATTPDAEILKNGACDHNPMRRWVAGRVALLGDSAHACTPNLGQGGGMAVEDAMVLAKSLRAEKSVEEALRIYEKRRTVRTRHIQQRSRLMGSIAQWENPFIVKSRELVTNLLPAKIFEFNLRRTYSYRT
ncbi:MAG: FAD-dependent monooxygenase [Acidobacteria bacterium]|nr:FAD-dependent monooxygenase [Acidobacteriota bacterium]